MKLPVLFLLRLVIWHRCVTTAAAGTTTGLGGSLVTHDYDVGTTATQLQVQATFPAGISAPGDTILFSIHCGGPGGLDPLFNNGGAASVSPTTTVTLSSGHAVWSAKATTTNELGLLLTLASGSVPAGDTVFVAISSHIRPFPSVGQVTLLAESNGGSGVVDTSTELAWFTVLTTGGSGGIVFGDPVTYYNDKKSEFILPQNQFTPLIQTPDLTIMAEPLPREGQKEQWIGRVVVTTNGPGKPEPVVDVRIKRHLAWFNRTTAHENGFETLDVTMEWFVPYPRLRVLPSHDSYFTHPKGTAVLVGRVRHSAKIFDMRAPRAEVVFVIGEYAKVAIFAASAHEYYGWNDYHGRKFAHLDVEIMNMRDEHLFSGVLPEIWGIKPLSEETRAMLKNSTEEETEIEKEQL